MKIKKILTDIDSTREFYLWVLIISEITVILWAIYVSFF